MTTTFTTFSQYEGDGEKLSFPTCLTCRFYVPNPQADHGVCHRYPKAEITSYSYWCGEFKETHGLETK